MSKSLYVAVDVGCIECGEETTVIGIYESKERAEAVLAKAREEQEKNWNGQHVFECHEVAGITQGE